MRPVLLCTDLLQLSEVLDGEVGEASVVGHLALEGRPAVLQRLQLRQGLLALRRGAQVLVRRADEVLYLTARALEMG